MWTFTSRGLVILDPGSTGIDSVIIVCVGFLNILNCLPHINMLFIPTYFQNSEPPIICYKYDIFVTNIINQSEILFLISINLFLILISMLILLSLEIVKIQNLFINQPDI